MKIALIGYGKMGRIIERIARERGHEIVSVVDVGSMQNFDSAEFASADVAIEFTCPSQAVDNYRRAWNAGLPVVSGTTGWSSQLDAVKEEVAQKGATLFWSSNFSLGVNIFFELNRQLAGMMDRYQDYTPSMTEIHHTEKKDAPSGTAISLASDIASLVGRVGRWCLAGDARPLSSDLPITALRVGKVPGTHTVAYESDVDKITISHEAKSRDGFALGAVLAAEFLAGRPAGFYSMRDMLGF